MHICHGDVRLNLDHMVGSFNQYIIINESMFFEFQILKVHFIILINTM